MQDPDHKEREHFFSAAKLVAALTMLSRVLGLIRDVAIVRFGATRATDSFWTAFRVPNTFRRLFGEGALSAAFVPVFTEVAEAQGWDKARLVLANAAGLLAAVLAGLTVLIEAGLLVWLWCWPGAWDRTLLLQLVMLVLPFMITICLLALGSAALNCKGHFAYPAFAPILLNIFLIAAAFASGQLFVGDDWRTLFLLSVAVIVAGVVQVGGVIWLLRRVGLAATPSLAPILPDVKRIARLALPMMIPLSIVQLSSLFDGFYAWVMTATPDAPTLEIFGMTVARPLESGVVTRLYAAERLYNFPLGILAISLATAVFPLLSRYASRGDTRGLATATNRALRLSLFLGIPSGVALILLAEPTLGAIYRRGRFSPADTARAASILQMYCLGMWAYFCNHILLRAFFAQKDKTTPLRVSLVRAVVNIALVAGLVFTPLKARAIGLATASTSAANALVLVWILHRRWGQIGLRQILASLGRTVVMTAVMGAAIWLLQRQLAPYGNFVVLAGCVPAGLVSFFIVARLLRAPELKELRGAKAEQADPQ